MSRPVPTRNFGLGAFGLGAGIALVTACSSGDGDGALAPDAALDDGWIGAVVASPDRFSGVVDGSARAGWVAFHGEDLRAAADALPDGVGRARARWALAAAEADLAELSHRVWEQTSQTWSERGGIPAGSALPIIAAINALDADDPDGARAWLARGGPYASAELTAVSAALAGGLRPLPGASGPAPCVNAELAARAALDRGPLAICLGAPLVTEGSADAPRQLYDPMLFTTLARIDRAAALAAVAGKAPSEALAPGGQPGLDSLLFSPWWSVADLRADLALDPTLQFAGASGPGWLDAAPSNASPSPDDARDRVGRLDRQLDAWLARRRESASDAGRELLDNLELGPVWRSQLLLGWARAALAADRPTEALVYAQSALDLGHARALAPRNPPGLFVVLADAWLRSGHAREALDALQPLREAWPELEGLVETLGDLVVLQGLGRPGDSKEN